MMISRRKMAKMIALGGTSLLFDPHLSLETLADMKKRRIPSTGEALPVVGLGTWQTFDVGTSSNEREPLKRVLQILLENGGSLIDSSPMYGRSEKVVGELTKELGIKGDIFEATKVWTRGRVEGIRQMQDSFKFMQVQEMELMQIHNLVDWKTHLKTLRSMKEEGSIKYIGITHYNRGAYAEVEQIMKTEKIDFLQINYNLAVRDASKRLLPLAKDKGIAVLINRPYEGGTLFRKFSNKKLPEWAVEFDANTWGQFFLKYILANDAVTCVIPGTGKPKHMLDNVQAGFGLLPNHQHLKMMIEQLKE